MPIVTHLHGGHNTEESDGYPEAWYLPQARNIPPGYARTGSLYQEFRAKAQRELGQAWTPGSAVFQYDNDQRASDAVVPRPHARDDARQRLRRTGRFLPAARRARRRRGGKLPGSGAGARRPARARLLRDPDRDPGPLLHRGRRPVLPRQSRVLRGPRPVPAADPVHARPGLWRQSDIAPIWNPEFFGNAIVVNGTTWPSLDVQQRRYRFRFLNGCNSRFLILRMSNGLPFWQIGNEGGFLPAPVELPELLLGPAERADVIVDFTNVALGTEVILENVAPDEPFGGGDPGVDFDPADPQTTGQAMRFYVVTTRASTRVPRRAGSRCRPSRHWAPPRTCGRSRSTSKSPPRCG